MLLRATPLHPAEEGPLPLLEDGCRFFLRGEERPADDIFKHEVAAQLPGTIFWDGSSDQAAIGDLKRAGWAAVWAEPFDPEQPDKPFVEVAALCGPVWAPCRRPARLQSTQASLQLAPLW